MRCSEWVLMVCEVSWGMSLRTGGMLWGRWNATQTKSRAQCGRGTESDAWQSIANVADGSPLGCVINNKGGSRSLGRNATRRRWWVFVLAIATRTRRGGMCSLGNRARFIITEVVRWRAFVGKTGRGMERDGDGRKRYRSEILAQQET